MKNYEWLRRNPAKLQSSFRPKNTIYGFLALLMLGLSGCDITRCGEDPEPKGVCNTLVTVEEDGCWQSSEGNFWFRTEQGKLLMPTSSLVNLPELKKGMQLKIAYEVVEQNPQNAIICNYLVATELPEQAIKITCAEALPFCGAEPGPQNCSIYATAETVICGAGVWANIWLRLDDGTLLQPWETNVQGLQLVNGQRYIIGYELMQRDNRYQNAVICQAVPPVASVARINCIEADLSTTNGGK
ncbi:hypothetical protein I5M27_11705 [Adhaeribacter sp. BT258]|uniref:DUF4377 domain-containing protein n=1 Tax=Adhaeribacter terrigena TaxID=2793070 RepID=A0ABS1C2P0_9BACT|nr:NigD-like N-terminal domain-containing protein [Adhaeribacter terrigena]MBK0403654.1 hypothetical protein [Adhaeribacter terrigena]